MRGLKNERPPLQFPESACKSQTLNVTCCLFQRVFYFRAAEGHWNSIEGGTMSLNVKTRKVDGIVVVDMSGRLTIGEPVLLLRETLRVQVNDGARNFVLNLGDVSYIDSSGLGELVSLFTTVRNKQGDVKLPRSIINLDSKGLAK